MSWGQHRSEAQNARWPLPVDVARGHRDLRNIGGRQAAWRSARQEGAWSDWSSEVRPHARREAPDPVFVIRRVDRGQVRIEDFEGRPYSAPMTFEEATVALREASEEVID